MDSGGALHASAAATEAMTPIGVARLSKMMFDGEDLTPLWRELIGKYVYQPDDAAALMDLATIEQLFGNREDGLARQAEALEICRLYRSPAPATSPRVKLLALAAPGDMSANTPLEFLLQESDVALETLYIAPGFPLPTQLPQHDVAFLAIGEADENAAALAAIESALPRWPRPVINTPARIAALSRQRLHAALAEAPGVAIPATVRVERAALAALAADAVALGDLLADGHFPIIARPVDSHAGRGLQKLDDPAAVRRYLGIQGEAQFYISRFIDYRGPDGLFRKYRIVFIEGRPYACHMAISDQWMIYYLNANMKESAEKRAEEAQFMRDFDGDFAARHSDALGAIAARVGLDYFGIDCGETRDGRLLVFEADIAMIVHAMDSVEIYPYKAPQMRKVFAAFRALLHRRSGRAETPA
jgi:glutathione synthase/RimK-type ligase-like ATP-grasp enzyme